MSNSSSSKSHSKKVNSRERDRNKSVASESGGSSQCDTPPLTEKDASTSQGKYAGIGPDSINCMAEQVSVEINAEAATNLAEDVSYKLRQIINNIAVQSSMLKKSQVDSWDVNTTLMLTDTSPVVGASSASYVGFGDEKLCAHVESVLNITECALIPQTYAYSNVPSLTVEWITDDRSLSSNSHISAQLHTYYTRVARAILNLKKKLKDVAVEDLTTNTRIGPIFPNLFNLAVLVLNDDNLKALNVPAKKPLQSNVLDMVDALCSNPCSSDTNIQQQFQRLFPVMVSNILGNGSLSEKMVMILTKITRTWPPFVAMGKEILFDYLSQGTKERLTAPMIKCITALGRQALVECLADHLDYLDDMTHAPRRNFLQTGLRETILDAATCLLRSELTTYLEDYVTTDYTLYEMLGDSVEPRRMLFPVSGSEGVDGTTSKEKCTDDDVPFTPMRTVRHARLKLLPRIRRRENSIHREAVFEPVRFRDKCRIQIKVKGFRTMPVRAPVMPQRTFHSTPRYGGVVVANGLLNRFRYKLNKTSDFPIFGVFVM